MLIKSEGHFGFQGVGSRNILTFFYLLPLFLFPINVTLTFIYFRDGVPVRLGHLDAMRVHPCPYQILLSFAYVAEPMEVLPQFEHKAAPYALRQCETCRLRQEAVFTRVSVFEIRQSNRQFSISWLVLASKQWSFLQIAIQDVILH